MALSKSDKEYFSSETKLVMKEEIETLRTEIKPFLEMVANHQTTLHGPEGGNGVYSQVQYLTKSNSQLKRIYAAIGIVCTGVLLFKEQIIQALGGK